MRNSLSFQQKVRLGDWLRVEKEKGGFDKQSRISLAKRAMTELGFNITYKNVELVAKAFNIPLPTRAAPGKGISNKNKTRAYLIRLKRAVIELYEKLNEPVPDYLNQIEEES